MDHAGAAEDYDDSVGSEGESAGEDSDHRQDGAQSSPSTTTGQNGRPVKPAAHLQKRRRVTRACDECRRKKIKCDGKQPCTHCTVYSYECTYDQPSNRRRNPAPQYVENLEHRVHRAETLLHILIPNLDLNDPGIDAAVAQGWIPGAPGRGNPTAAQAMRGQQPQQRSASPQQSQDDDKFDANIQSMVRATAELDMDEMGNWDYHGHSSGISFVRRMREQLGDLIAPDKVFVKTRPMSQILESPKSTVESPMTGELLPSGIDLPPQQLAEDMCRLTVDNAAALLQVVHKPTFWQSFEHLYTVPPEHYTNEDHKFLPLFHSAIALGHLFGKDDSGSENQEGYESAIQQGFVHFKHARQLMDIADCRDLMSIQAVVFMIHFLQASARMSQCYAYIGVALRSAMRMGLHRSYPGTFSPLEAETRKRVFWVVRKMDVYVAAMLGLPQTLSDDDIDQEFPAEVDDEYVTKDGIEPMPEGQISLMTAFNAHTRLTQILTKIMRYIYPIKVTGRAGTGPDMSYSVPFSAIREIESDLEEWKNGLPPLLSPCPAPEQYTRVQQLLRLAYAHTQVMLYRPFLHFVAMEKRQRPIDQRAYACAASYVNVSRNIIHITTQMQQKGLLNGAFWFIMYTCFFAILSLVYFAAENPDSSTAEAVIKDALEGKEVLASLAKRSMAADRCTATLDIVFEKLPEWMRKGHPNPITTKKRSLDSASSTPKQSINSRSHLDTSAGRSENVSNNVKRASTFPKSANVQASTLTGSPSAYDSWPQSAVSTLGPRKPTTTTEFGAGSFNSYNPLSGVSVGPTGLQQYSLPPANFPNPAIADLSTMMFGAADEPFGYPNQPLTTFENQRVSAIKSEPYVSAAYNGGVNSTLPPDPLRGVATDGEDNMEAQFFALPPYIEHRQQQQQHVMGFPTGVAGDAFSHGGQGLATSALAGWPTQQQTQPQQQVNISEIFGEGVWNPMLMDPTAAPFQ